MKVLSDIDTSHYVSTTNDEAYGWHDTAMWARKPAAKFIES